MAGAALAYSNMIGGQDELIFDGGSILVDADGNLLARGPQFEEALIVTDLELQAAPEGPAGTTVARVDTGDGTVITIRQVELDPPADVTASAQWPAIEHETAVAVAAGLRRGVQRAGARGARLRGARTASAP